MRFHQQGKYVAEGNKIRKQEQLAKLKARVDEEVRKKGLDTTIVSDILTAPTAVPEVEWWDLPFTANGLAGVSPEAAVEALSNAGTINSLIYVPDLFSPAVNEPKAATVQPLMLTTKEQKKMRRQRRQEEQKLQREKINLGLLPKEEPKLKMTNYMAALGSELLNNPTRAEAMVREQIKAREDAHKAANKARQLTKEERSEKKRLKLANEFYHPKEGFLHAHAYRLRDLSRPQWRSKVKNNAIQLHLFGTMMLHKDQNLIIVEGGARSMRKFHRLLTERINWHVENVGGDGQDAATNECILVWKGTTVTSHFRKFEVLTVDTELQGITFLEEKGLEFLWSYSKSVDKVSDVLFGHLEPDSSSGTDMET